MARSDWYTFAPKVGTKVHVGLDQSVAVVVATYDNSVSVTWDLEALSDRLYWQTVPIEQLRRV